jgi:acetyl-CoA decarbonylase/synthase complex subunit delta
LGNLGVSDAKILIDPTTGGLGYGMEYCYSVIERIRMAALTQDDDKLMLPIINYVGQEVWKVKECRLTNAEAPELGDQAKRGVMMEAVTAASLLLAGSDLLILRHPETVKMIKTLIDELS